MRGLRDCTIEKSETPKVVPNTTHVHLLCRVEVDDSKQVAAISDN